MNRVRGYAALSATAPLTPYQFERRLLREQDVDIEILYCGVCHSDVHQARNEWGGSQYPMVPGHEIVGRVTAVGRKTSKFKTGDSVAVGCMVDACRRCTSCQEAQEQFCEQGASYTYNSYERDGITLTQGGYSNRIVVHEDFVLRVPSTFQALAPVAPLLCAGITTYSPLMYWQVGPGRKVGIIGLGGLGHMAVQIAAALGAEVTVFTSTEAKRADAMRFGATTVISDQAGSGWSECEGSFDLMLDTVSAQHEINPYLTRLKRDGVLVLLGVPEQPLALRSGLLINGRRRITGSLIGGLQETQAALDFCAKHTLVAQVEVIPIQSINDAYARMLRNEVNYRFVIDMQSLR